MGHLPDWSPQRRRQVAPWARHRTRRWIRANNTSHAGMLFAAIPSLPRAELSRLTERMIDRMDEIDGDPDREAEEDVCSAHDDGCGPVLIRGTLVWGSEHDADGCVVPLYGLDQSAGPINDAEDDGGWASQR